MKTIKYVVDRPILCKFKDLIYLIFSFCALQNIFKSQKVMFWNVVLSSFNKLNNANSWEQGGKGVSSLRGMMPNDLMPQRWHYCLDICFTCMETKIPKLIINA